MMPGERKVPTWSRRSGRGGETSRLDGATIREMERVTGASRLGRGRRGGACACARLKPHENGRMNVASLLASRMAIGGRGAIGSMGATYKARFRLRGNVPQVSVQAVYWPNDPKSPDDRSYVNIIKAPVDEGWQHYEVTFTLPTSVLPLTDVQRAEGGNPWQITWVAGGGLHFRGARAGRLGNRAPGQRLGPARPPQPRPWRRASLCRALLARLERRSVCSIACLPPADTPSDAIALAVETALRNRYRALPTQPRALRVHHAARRAGDGWPTQLWCWRADRRLSRPRSLGNRLSLGAASVTIARGRYAGRVAGTGSARGEAWFVLDGELPKEGVRPGETLFIEADGMRRAYPHPACGCRGRRDTRLYEDGGDRF